MSEPKLASTPKRGVVVEFAVLFAVPNDASAASVLDEARNFVRTVEANAPTGSIVQVHQVRVSQ